MKAGLTFVAVCVALIAPPAILTRTDAVGTWWHTAWFLASIFLLWVALAVYLLYVTSDRGGASTR